MSMTGNDIIDEVQITIPSYISEKPCVGVLEKCIYEYKMAVFCGIGHLVSN